MSVYFFIVQPRTYFSKLNNKKSYSGYIVAQFIPSFGSLIATGFLVGIAAAPLVSSSK